MKKILFILTLFFTAKVSAQKKILDHTVYDNWKSIAEKMISNDGAWVVYTVNPQEGDGELIIQNPSTQYKKIIERGYNAVITEDSRFLVFKIKPHFQDTRLAKIRNLPGRSGAKKPAEAPKDSIGIIELGKDSIFLKDRIKSFKTPLKGAGFVAYHLEKAPADTAKKKVVKDSLETKNNELEDLADSLIAKSLDSVKGNISKEKLTVIINKAAQQILKQAKDDVAADADGDDAASSTATAGTDLVLKNLTTGKEKVFKWVNEFYFDKKGTKLIIETSKKSGDSTSKPLLLLVNLSNEKTDTILTAFNESRNYVFDDNGMQLAFVAERDSSEKALLKFFKLYTYTTGQDSARSIIDKFTPGMQLGYGVSENARLEFSKDGSKLFFGTAPIRSPKDTTLVDFELARLDIWNYKDDYLQPQQLRNADAELKRSYMAVYHVEKNKMVQLGTAAAENITIVNEGNADWVLAESTAGNRVETQWLGRAKSSAYIISLITGERKPIYKNLKVNTDASPAGRFVVWYNRDLKNYFTYEVASGISRNVTATIKVPLFEEDNDVPDQPSEYGVMGWQQADSSLYVYDRYNVWKVAPDNSAAPVTIFANNARSQKNTYRFINTDREQRDFSYPRRYLFSSFNNTNKQSGLFLWNLNSADSLEEIVYNRKSATARHTIAKSDNSLIFSIEDFTSSPNLFYYNIQPSAKTALADGAGKMMAKKYYYSTRLSDINPQQTDYSWGNAALYSWKTYSGKSTTGIVYKPENFDPKKKYPMICYFYEKLSDGLYNYVPPAPTPSRLNISFFVSRGYIVFAPDIFYTTGHPGNDAYNCIVSGARALVKEGFVDSTKIGIQGQSWGGYQVAHLITRTKLFAAAWAGAPVVNMTSAYGGIRWESGMNRQFQYEKTQSRIGATLWEKPQLYIENSPLFHMPNVTTPVAIMSNDADGAVPWYQGIEMFTALRRLSKPVWLLNYNGEAHNLVERRNRKDIQIREQQFFDWLLKGEKPARWLTDGVPAIDKGKDWGL